MIVFYLYRMSQEILEMILELILLINSYLSIKNNNLSSIHVNVNEIKWFKHTTKKLKNKEYIISLFKINCKFIDITSLYLKLKL